MNTQMTVSGANSFALVSAKGSNLGTRYAFVGQKSARSLAGEAKAMGLKGKAKREFVNKSLTGDFANAGAIAGTAFLAACVANGIVPTHGDVTKNGFVLRGQRPVVTKAAKAVATVAVTSGPEFDAAVEKAVAARCAAVEAKLAAMVK